MASRLDHPTISADTLRARQHELARAAERSRRATEGRRDRASLPLDGARVSGLPRLLSRWGRAPAQGAAPTPRGRVPG
jgi:hypothetical protein